MTQITEWDPHLRMPDTVARPLESSHRRPFFILNRSGSAWFHQSMWSDHHPGKAPSFRLPAPSWAASLEAPSRQLRSFEAVGWKHAARSPAGSWKHEAGSSFQRCSRL